MAEGYPCAQIYAPPDLDVACFAPMTAPTNALASGDDLATIAPGGRFSARFVITVETNPGVSSPEAW